MSTNEKPAKTRLEVFVKQNFPRVLAEVTQSTLGDRSKYIGASDCSSCLRKSYLGKIHKVDYDFDQHIVFERGHLTESLVEKMLDGLNVHKQVTVKSKASNGFPIEAHLDFVVDFGTEAVVIEVKSTNAPVEVPYDSWVIQTQFQIGLLQQKRPNKLIRGYIIAVDVNSGWFDTFEVQPNELIFNIAMDKAEELAEAMVSKKEPSCELQLYCTKCPFKMDCPAIANAAIMENAPKDVQDAIYVAYKYQREAKLAQNAKNLVKSFQIATGIKQLHTPKCISTLNPPKEQKRLDIERLQIEEPAIYKKYLVDNEFASWIKIT